MSKGKRIGWVVLVLAAAFAVAAQPAMAGKKPRPDFATKSVTILGATPYYIVRDRTDSGLVVSIKVKNQGKAAADGNGTLTVRGDGLLRPTKFQFEIPGLGPGKTDTIEFDVKGNQLDGITTYATEACARAKRDSNRGNDCRTGPDFAVIPRTWTGSVNATWTDGIVFQSLVANPVTFTFNGLETGETDTFAYDPTGSLTATITGDTDPTCTYSGTGDIAIDPAQAALNFTTDLQHYAARGRIGSNTPYTAQVSCPDESGAYSQEFGEWLDTPDAVSREAADEVLTDTYAAFGDSWTWNLRAE